jgi:glucose/arabinose dehydrogenase
VFALVAGFALASAGACSVGLRLLPERYAVNAPVAQLLLGRGTDAPSDATLRTLAAPEGFAVSLYATEVPNARFLRFTSSGDLLVSTPRSGRIAILERDADGDGRADAVRTLLDGLDRPHGLDLHDGWLYVGEGSAVARIRYDAATRRTSGGVERVVTGLPSGGNHWTRTLRFGPDAWMYVSVGSSCNVCVEDDPRRAAMLRFRPDGSQAEVFATGLRNSVGFDWQPATGDLYATDNGRDLLGDDVPPCELNRIERGGFYGWPFAYGDRVRDPDLGEGRDAEIAASRPPAHAFRAHTAPLGITFVRGANAPAALRGAALVALHGSWNRTRKDGYEVVSLHWSDGGRIEERDFLSGFVRDERAIGRPVDVAEGPDGAIYVSDDYAGVVYRVAWQAGGARAAEAVPASTARAPRDPLASIPAAERDAMMGRGRALYEAHACFRCHETARADANAVPVPLAQLAGKYDVEGLAAFLAAPQPPMPLFPLTAAERRDLAASLLAPTP